MLSATTADSRLSMAPSRAKEAAVGSICATLARDRSGRCGAGRERGMPPKREPMVAIGRCSRAARTDAAATPIRNAGQCGRNRRTVMMMTMVSSATAIGAHPAVGRADPRASSLGTNGPGSGPLSVRPSNSLIWPAKMMTAMPEVKPTVTG